MKKRLSIIGSTGSIGEQALDVVRKHPDKFEVVAIGTGRNARRLAEQAREFGVSYVALFDKEGYDELSRECSADIGYGREAIEYIAQLEDVDQVLVAVSGAAGIFPALKAAQAGKQIALANKESLVAAGEIIMPMLKRTGATILPVDSEHSAIFQCIRNEAKSVERLWLTASGGPFRGFDIQELSEVGPEMALRHPNWSMGQKITIDSATLLNKGLEVIEAHHLFNVDYNNIEVVIHPESIIHSMVEFNDGALLAHLGVPDMRIPIQYAFTYPERWESPAQRLDLFKTGRLQFERPDNKNFPALQLAYQAGRQGGTMPAVMNAANEVAVQEFLSKRLSFIGIVNLVEKTMNKHDCIYDPGLEDILAADAWAREVSCELLKELSY